MEWSRARRERPVRSRRGQPVLSAGQHSARVLPRELEPYDVPLEGGSELLRRRGRRPNQQGRRVVLSRNQGGGEQHHGLRRLLARREGGGLATHKARDVGADSLLEAEEEV